VASLAIDHVLVAVDDLAAAGALVEARHGLVSVDGGSHPGWGTANRIVPLGDAYLELVAIVDPDLAARSTFGRWVAAATPGEALGWAVRTGAIDDVAGRLDLPIAEGSRATPGGDILRWRSAGLDVAAAEPGLPFFIEWRDGVRLPGATAVAHPGGDVRLRRLRLSGDAARLAAWLGRDDLPVAVTTGRSGVVSVVLERAEEEFAFDARAQ
jgi:hypothetical protein